MDYDDHCTVVIVIWDLPKCDSPPLWVGVGGGWEVCLSRGGPPFAKEALVVGGHIIIGRYPKKSLNLWLGVWSGKTIAFLNITSPTSRTKASHPTHHTPDLYPPSDCDFPFVRGRRKRSCSVR